MPTNEFQAVISAVDAATANIRKISGEVKGLQTHVVGVDKAEKKVGSTHGFAALSTHVDLLRGHFSGLRATIGRVGGGISSLLPMLGGLGAAASAGGLFELANSAAEAASKLAQSAKILGMTRRQFDEFGMAAKLTDVPVQQMQTALGMLGKTIGAAAGGQNKAAAALFEHLGISLRDAHGHVLSVTQAMPELAQAFMHTTSSSERLRMATALFGRAGQQLLPMLIGGKAALTAFARVADRVDYVPTHGAQAKLESFHRSWIEITAATTGFQQAVGAKLGPILQPIIASMGAWVAKNCAWIATDIADAVKGLTTAVKALIDNKVARWVGHGVSMLGQFLQTSNGARVAAIALAAAMGPLMVVSVMRGIGALADLRESLMAMQVVLMGNPIYLIAAVLAAAAVAIYEYWGPLKAFFHEVWGGIKSAVMSAWNYLKPILEKSPMVFAAMEIISHWKPLKAFFIGLWAGIESAFVSAWGAVSPVIDKVRGAIQWVMNSWVGRGLGLATGGGPGGAVRRASVTPGAHGATAAAGSPALQQLVRTPLAAAGRGAAAAQVHGHLATTVTFRNAPPGTRVETKTSGMAAPPTVSVGYAAPAFGF